MKLKPIKGQHHVSAITSNAKGNYEFYTKIMGLRLVKKSINQDDTSIYHLFYADERGNPGTDLTFFEIPNAGKARHGNNAISLTSLRVPTDDAIRYWKKRLVQFNIEHDEIKTILGHESIAFRDFEGQRMMLISDEHNSGVAGGKPWSKSPVPSEYGIIGLGPITLTVSRAEQTAKILTDIMGYRKKGIFSSNIAEQEKMSVYESGEGGHGAEIYLVEEKELPSERQGSGSVHHVAFRVENEEELRNWIQHLNEAGIANSGFVERYYFRSIYFREPNGILFEIATDGPGFEGDEPFETLGERLALPPYFEDQRKSIEAKLKPLETSDIS